MKIRTEIEVCAGRYNVQVDTFGWTAQESMLLAEFGEPTIDIGGNITGSLGRPGETNTVVAITGGGGTDAVVVPVIADGIITGFTVTSPGSGYTSTPSAVITGDGTGASATVVLSGTAVSSLTLVAGGTGYHVSPIVVDLTLPSAIRRIRSDMPAKMVFDLADDPNSDVYAQVYANVISSRLIAAKNALVANSTPFAGESVTTV